MRFSFLANKSAIFGIMSSLVFIQVNSVYAVSEAAAIFLLISPSPRSNGMGNTYGNSASEDPMASIMNPAYLGFYSKNHNFGLAYSNADWMPALVSDMSYSCHSLSFGYTLKNKAISFGLGYHHIFMDYGEQAITSNSGPEIIGTFNAWDKADMLSASLLLDYYIQAGFGFSYKFIESHLTPIGAGKEKGSGKGSASAFDFGVAVHLPVFEIISHKLNKQITILPNIKPFFQPGFSYSTANIGDKIFYMDAEQADPLPRTAYIGVNSSIGIKYFVEGFEFEIISYKEAYEANGFLVKRFNKGRSQYLSTFFNVDKDDIIYNNGWELNFMDTFFFREGHSNDKEGRVKYDTNGFGINFMQPFRILYNLNKYKIKNTIIEKLINNLDIEFHHGEHEAEMGDPLSDIRFDGVTIKIKTIF